jgi:hypothetical protein
MAAQVADDSAALRDCAIPLISPRVEVTEVLDHASIQFVTCPTCGQNMQQLPGKKQIDHYRRCVVTAFNQTSQEMVPILESAVNPVHSTSSLPSFSSVGEWLQHLDLQQYHRLFLSAGHTMRSIHTLTEAQLVALGVPTVGARRRMLIAVDVLKRSMPQPVEEPPLQAKKRNKTSAQKATPLPAAATKPAAAAVPSLNQLEQLQQLRSIVRITEKAAEQTAATMLLAAPPAAPAPLVPFLADSVIPHSVPLFPGSIMRRVCSHAHLLQICIVSL